MYYTIETTSNRNGYPTNLKEAVIGFETYEEAQEYARENGMEICSFFKKQGWDLWVREGYIANAFQLNASMFSDDYSHYDWNDGERYMEEAKQQVADFKEYDGWEDERCQEYLEECEQCRDEIDNLQEGEFACVANNQVCEVYKLHCMEYSHDGTTHVIGCI